MKKLLKSIVCGIHKQFTEEKSKSYHRKKKKKNSETQTCAWEARLHPKS